MARRLEPVDVTTVPALARLVDEVRATGRPRRLRRNAAVVAVLVPTPRTRRRAGRRISKADRAAFLASAGTWMDVDTDALVTRIYEERDADRRPPIEL
ncbi:MAG: hypothetical protein U0531_07405 [Dehalococcoidia bacterium]